jgi:hypothetical protein
MSRIVLILAVMAVLLAACGQNAPQVAGDAARGSEIFHNGVKARRPALAAI